MPEDAATYDGTIRTRTSSERELHLFNILYPSVARSVLDTTTIEPRLSRGSKY